jgi:FkbM family methyltransferase
VTPGSVTRWAHLLGRRLLTGTVHRLPPRATEAFRGPAVPPRSPAAAIRLMVTHLLRRGGIPAAVDAFVLLDNPCLRFVNADSLVLQQLYWFGEQGWEPELLAWWRYLCRRSSSIVELGTNVGYYTVQGARAAPHARYLAVEPHPASVRACRANLALNRIDSVEVIAAAAVADPSVTSTELIVPWEQLAAPTVAFMPTSSELPSRMTRRHGAVLTVPAVDVRSLLTGVDLLKLDVEGQEHELLAAGWEHLQARHPTVIIEVLPGTPRLRALLVALCEDLGYRCYAPVRDRLVPLAARSIPDLSVQHTFGGNDLIMSADPNMPTDVSDLVPAAGDRM